MKLVNLTIKSAKYVLALILFVLVLILFNFEALKIIIAAAIIYIIPVFLILGKFELTLLEKIFFSIGISFGLFATITYYLYFLFGSLKISAIASFILLLFAGIAVKFDLINKILKK